MRYSRADLDNILEQINAEGFGLTFGVHIRIDEMSLQCVTHIDVGNVDVNRNIVGASVGAQPFGGQGLSGTGPKAGGPLYLRSLVHRDGHTLPAWAANNADANGSVALALPGPIGESNVHQLLPRGPVLCLAQTRQGLPAMCEALSLTGNKPQVLKDTAQGLSDAIVQIQASNELTFAVVTGDIASIDTEVILFEGDTDHLLAVHRAVAQRNGAIVPVFGLRTKQIEAGHT